MIIQSKAEFYNLWKMGILGNRTRLWTNVVEAVKSGCPRIGFREIGQTGGGAWELVERKDAFVTATRWEQLGRRFIMDDGAPNYLSTLVGEVTRTYRGWEGTLAVEPWCSMRDAMRRGLLLPRSSSVILYLLNKYMDPSSIDDLRDLLDLYPEATVEFSCFTIDVGNIPGRSTLFWEVRNY
jgi:hypothetical protein